MELKTSENKNGHFHFVFADETADKLVEIPIRFFVDWKLDFKFLIGPKAVPVPFDFKKILMTIPVHIPKQNKQFFFKRCMDFVIKETDMPTQVEQVPHPGYPLMAITFNPKIIDTEKMNKILETILNAIEGMQVTETEKPKEEEEVDPLDEIDEDNVIEYEEDPELKEALGFFRALPEETEDSDSVYVLEETEEGDKDD